MAGADEGYEGYLRTWLDRKGRQFQRLSETAEGIADAAEASARVHDQMAEQQPGAAEHAARERRLAAAEREAARAFRAGELPSKASRDAIRTGGSNVDGQETAD